MDSAETEIESNNRNIPRSKTSADLVIELAQEADLFHTPEKRAYADVIVRGHRETFKLDGSDFRNWLARKFYESTGRVASPDTIKTAIANLEAKAQFHGPERAIFTRIAEVSSAIYLDLADTERRVVEIDANGWRVIAEPPVRFIRTRHMLALPAPVGGGSIAALEHFLNIKTKADFVLVVHWLVAALRPKGPYPVLALSGEQGSAKSTFVKILRMLIDPNTAPHRAMPGSERELFIAAGNAHILAFDNLSSLSPAMSDSLCRLATGGAFGSRRLFTDDEEQVFQATRPIVLNGIDGVIRRSDLADRAIRLELPTIPDANRRTEMELLDAFERARPATLGALLDGVSASLRRWNDITVDGLSRMADFERSSIAGETAFWPDGTFRRAYLENRAGTRFDVIEADPVASSVQALMSQQIEWHGTASQLLDQIRHNAGDGQLRLLPSAPNLLSDRLNRAASALRGMGISITQTREGHNRTRTIHIVHTVPAARSSASSAPAVHLGAARRPTTRRPQTARENTDQDADDTSVKVTSQIAVTTPKERRPKKAADDADDADDQLSFFPDGYREIVSAIPGEPDDPSQIQQRLVAQPSGEGHAEN